VKVGDNLEITVTAKILIKPNKEQQIMLYDTIRAYSKACNYVSGIVFDTHNVNQIKLQKETYNTLRSEYNMPSQMACNAVRHVIGNYKTIQANQKEWIKPDYKHTAYPLSWNRDYSLNADLFSVGTLNGRIKLEYSNIGMEKYFDGSWIFGLAKVVNKHGKWFLHISMSKNFEQLDDFDVYNVVGVDLGINFTATTYDSNRKTMFFNGKHIKHKRGQYKKVRQQLQKRQTASSRRRLKAIGSRENRWINDVNHCVSKTLVESNPKGTAFILEDLTGIRNATEKVIIKDRYVTVSWAFYDLRLKFEYKAKMTGNKVIIVEPKYTSQTCPKCGHTEKANRDKKNHIFCCRNCKYTSNDDRIGAMNLHRKGIEYLSAVAAE
jgi:IS605 OrfB family transposase